jgi:hypothetical protein
LAVALLRKGVSQGSGGRRLSTLSLSLSPSLSLFSFSLFPLVPLGALAARSPELPHSKKMLSFLFYSFSLKRAAEGEEKTRTIMMMMKDVAGLAIQKSINAQMRIVHHLKDTKEDYRTAAFFTVKA